MMDKSRAELLAGSVIVVALVILSLMVFIVADIGDIWKHRIKVVIHFNKVGGIQVGSIVRYAGLEKGKVVELRHQQGTDKQSGMPLTEVLVITKMDKDVVLRENDEPQVVELITGTQWVDITSKPGPELKPVVGGEFDGSYELYGLEVTSLADIMQRVASLLDERKISGIIDSLRRAVENVEQISQDVQLMLGENKESFSNTIASLETTSKRIEEFVADNSGTLSGTLDELREMVAENRDTVKKAVGNFESLGGRLNDLVEEHENELGEAVGGIKAFTAQLEGVGERAAAFVEQAEKLLSENRVDLHEAAVLLKESAAELRLGLEEIRRNPWKLVHRPGEADVALRNFYESVRALNRVTRSVRESVAALENAEGEDAEALREQLRKELADLEQARAWFFETLSGGFRGK